MKVVLKNCSIQSVRANLVDNTTRIAFDIHGIDNVLDVKRWLALLAYEKSVVELTLDSPQLTMNLPQLEEATKPAKADD